ncbi:MAG: hypothetical protein ACXV74_00355 [Methylobacter sp.]
MNSFNNVKVINEQPSNTQLATISDRIAAMQAKVLQPIELWMPGIGDCLIGEIFDKRIVKSQFGDQEQFIVRNEHGALTAYWLNKYISEQLKAQGATYGSIVAITYGGKAETSTGKSYHKYSVLVDA